MSLKDNIRLIRESKGITQEEMADRLQKTRSNYAYLESRGEKLTIEQLESIANAMGVDMLELLGRSNKNDSELEYLQKEVKQLKEIVERDRSTIDNYNRILKAFDENKLATAVLAMFEKFNEERQKRIDNMTEKEKEEYEKRKEEIKNTPIVNKGIFK